MATDYSERCQTAFEKVVQILQFPPNFAEILTNFWDFGQTPELSLLVRASREKYDTNLQGSWLILKKLAGIGKEAELFQKS